MLLLQDQEVEKGCGPKFGVRNPCENPPNYEQFQGSPDPKLVILKLFNKYPISITLQVSVQCHF
jgi:hypothetical protein